jgi:hypothetical protein
MSRLLLLPLLALAGCSDGQGSGDTTETPTDTASTPISGLIDDLAWLARASLDLRGIRPSLDELNAITDGTATVPDQVDDWLQDPRFPQRMAWLWNDVLHTATWADDYSRFGDLEFAEWRAIGQEPLQLIAAIIDEDRPFSDVLTSSESRIDRTLAEIWGLEAAGDDWAWIAYTDGRPAAGLLSTNTLWLRYTADAVNYNRTRANSVADLFLCADFLKREGGFSFAVSPEALADVERAVAEQPACLTCHSALDPLASFFGGFAERSVELPADQYLQWSQHSADFFAARIPPAYFGIPGGDVADLGAMMAQDPRFAACAAGRFYEGLVRTPPTLVEQTAWGARFTELDMDVRHLVSELVVGEAYRADDGRLLRTEQIGEALTELLAWGSGSELSDGLNPLSWSEDHRLLGGGTDDDTVLIRNNSPGVGLQVLLEWTARQAAGPALSADLARAEPQLLTAGIPVDESGLRAQLVVWHARFLSRPTTQDAPEIDALVTLWQDAGGSEDPESALTEVLGAFIRHPASVVY